MCGPMIPAELLQHGNAHEHHFLVTQAKAKRVAGRRERRGRHINQRCQALQQMPPPWAATAATFEHGQGKLREAWLRNVRPLLQLAPGSEQLWRRVAWGGTGAGDVRLWLADLF